MFIVAVLDFTTGRLMDRIYADTVKGDYGRNNYIATGIDADCVILGSSRAIHHYDPDAIGAALGMTCYNAGEDGMGIVTMYGRYREIRQRYIPMVIIYDVAAAFDVREDDMSKYIGWLRLHADIDSVADLIYSVDAMERYKMLACSYRYNSRFIDIVAQSLSSASVTSRNYTFSPLVGHITYDVDPPKVDRKFKVSAFKLSLFERMIKQCKDDGTIFIAAISPSYQATDDSESTSVIRLCRKYNVPVLNHFTDERFNFNPKLFYDSPHLNIDGVRLYNNIIIGELKDYFRISQRGAL